MPWKRVWFCLYVALLWPAAIFVNDRLYATCAPLLWWLVYQSGGTKLTRSVFDMKAWLPLAFTFGFLLGLVPLARLKDYILATFAPGRIRREPLEPPELNPSRPILWVWVLPTLAFLLCFISYDPPKSHSVLGFDHPSRAPFSYFFGVVPPDDYVKWLYTRLFFTSPMLFTGAYALAVLLRHRLPNLRHRLPVPISPDPADTLGS